MSRTEKQIGAPEGYESRDPTTFSNPAQKVGTPPSRPVNSAPEGNTQDHVPTAAGVMSEGQPSRRVRVEGGNPRVPAPRDGKE